MGVTEENTFFCKPHKRGIVRSCAVRFHFTPAVVSMYIDKIHFVNFPIKLQGDLNGLIRSLSF